MSYLHVKKIVEAFKLEVLAGREGLTREIFTSDIARPGLEIAGYFTYHTAERVQVLGMTEVSFFNELPVDVKRERMRRLCAENTPCIVVARSIAPPPELLEAAEVAQVPVLQTKLPTTKFISKLTNFLESAFAPSTTVHGVLVDIYGVGVLITGGSGIGKSETALELVKRGHRLIADDAVEIKQSAENVLIGRPPELIRHLLEIRGLGIINVMTLFGAGAVRPVQKISMVCRLENWEEEKAYDRLGLDEQKVKIIDTYVPEKTIPVRPGRNLAVIVEVAAMDFRLKRMGINAAESFAQRLTEAIEDGEEY